MAITYSRTATTTKTFTRIDLLKLQVVIAMRRARIDPGTVNKIRTGVEKGWIEKIVVYGIDANNLAWCQLTTTIDWSQHKLHLTAGRITVSIDDRWENDTAIEVDETLGLFEQYTRAKGLTSKAYVWYSNNVDRKSVQEALGFVTAEPMEWAGKLQGTAMKIPELDELAVGFDMVP
jgi:hypothetical protein